MEVSGIREVNGNKQWGSILSVDEATSEFPGQWILMRVTEFDRYRNPYKGEVVEHSRNNPRITKVLREIASALHTPEQPYYLFYGSPRTESGLQMRRALARLSETASEGTPREW